MTFAQTRDAESLQNTHTQKKTALSYTPVSSAHTQVNMNNMNTHSVQRDTYSLSIT